MQNNSQITEANLSLAELEALAEEIRLVIMGDKGLSLEQYIEKATKLDMNLLGIRKSRAITYESQLESFFPDEVFRVLKEKSVLQSPKIYNEYDINFVKEHWSKGYKWLGRYMYNTPKNLAKVVRRLHIEVQSEKKLVASSMIEFIKKHKDKGARWIANNLLIDRATVNKHAKKHNIEIYNPQKEHAFTPEEDKFMRDHYEQGTAWLAKNLKRNIDSVFGRLKKLGIKAPVIHNGKNCKRFTLSDDVYMKVYAHKGAIWLSQFLNAHVKTIQDRARRKNIKLATQKEISRRETCQNNQTNTEKC